MESPLNTEASSSTLTITKSLVKSIISFVANRQLKSEDPLAADLYLEAFKAYADNHDKCGRLADLQA
jgi:hypothetical protein